MKLSLLFAKFLYQQKQLNLPGIGVFSIDPSVTLPELTEKNSHEYVQHIRYAQKTVVKPDEEFIEFIRVHTGKIRPLAESDLESFLSDGKILLNIGKPFHLEGIGTLQKNRSGAYEFHPGLPLVDKLDNFFAEKDTRTAQAKQTYEQEYDPAARTQQSSGRTIWIVLAILVGLGAIIWGGYSLYNRNTDSNGVEARNSEPEPPAASSPDTSKAAAVADSTTLTADTPAATTSTQTASVSGSSRPYKFIFRLASRNYVMNRYNDLKPSNPSLNWDTKDSIVYRLFLLLPVNSSDTARVRDSLQTWYGTKKVIIE